MRIFEMVMSKLVDATGLSDVRGAENGAWGGNRTRTRT